MQGREIVVERQREAAGRGDDKLDAEVEITADHQVDDVDQISRCLPGQFGIKKYDGVVAMGAECGGHQGSSLLHRNAGEPQTRQTKNGCGKMARASFGGLSRVSSRARWLF